MARDLLEDVSRVRLIAQDSQVAAVAARFCERDGLTLEEKRIAGLLTRGRAFVNASTGALRFDVKKKLFGGHVVLDSTKSPIVNFDTKTFSSKPIYYVHAGKKSDKRSELFHIVAYYSSDEKSSARVGFRDINSGEKCEVSFEGHWRNREALFWLRKGRSERLEAVAKVFRPEDKPRVDYRVEIAPNMDTVLITLLVHILADGQSAKAEEIANMIGG